MTNTAAVVLTQGLKIWHVNAIVTIAKCVKTGRFVNRALAQRALNFRNMMHSNNRADALNMALLPLLVLFTAIFTSVVAAVLIPEGFFHLIVAAYCAVVSISACKDIVQAVLFDLDKPAI